MADQKVTELPIKGASGINLADYLFGIDAAEGYQMLISDLAKKIIEDYAGSSVAGSSQALKTALDGINTKIGSETMGTTATTLTGAIAEHEDDISDLNTTAAAKGNKALWVDMGTISSLPVTKVAAGVTTDMVIAESVLGTPEAQASDWSINTDTAGSVTVSGTIASGETTTLKLLLVPQNEITAS